MAQVTPWLVWLAAAVTCLHPAGSASSKRKLQSLHDELSAMVEQEQTMYFSGSSKLLAKIAKLEEGEARLQILTSLGFASINDQDYKGCAAAFDILVKVRRKLEAAGKSDTEKPALGLARLAKFCENMKSGRVLDALSWCRQALPILQKEFSGNDAFNMLQFRFYSLNAELFDPEEFPGLSVNDQPPNAVSLYDPGLTPRTWHKSKWFVAARGLEENFERIAKEMDAFLADPAAIDEMKSVGRTSCRQDALLVKKGDWRDIGLYKKGVQDRRLCWKYFPHTCNIIEKHVPEVASSPWGIVSISRLGPGSDTMQHSGNTNALLTMHLGIHTPKEAGMLVGEEKREPAWERGKVTVFDDSFEHQVWHNGSPKKSIPRVVLLIRFWHPDLSLDERLHKTLTSAMITPPWLKTWRMHLLNSSEAQKRWRMVSKEFRAGVGFK